MSFSKARRTVVKLAVIAVSGGLIAALALPANAFNNQSESVPESALAPRIAEVQDTAVSSTIELAVSRDGYTAVKPPPPPVVRAAAATVNRFVTLNPPAQVYSGQAVVDFAMQFVGIVPYGMGSSPTASFSCDGLTQFVFGNFGIGLPRTADAQAHLAVPISAADAQPGDLVWWPGQHIGIYAGGGMMVDSPDWGRYVEHHGIWGYPVFMRLV